MTGFCVVVVGLLVVVSLVVVVLLVVDLLVVLLVVVVLVVRLVVLDGLWVVVGSGLSVTTQNLFFPEVPFFTTADFFLHAGVVAGVVAGDGVVAWVARGISGICGPF